MHSEWYRDFFKGLAVELWRRVIPPEATRQEVDFVLEMLALSPQGRVLDAPCGHGRHSIDLALRGFAVTGVDLSEECLAHARSDADGAGVTVDWIHADVRELPVERPFDGALCLGNSFGYLDHAGTQSFVSRLAQAVRARGRVVVNTAMVAESLLPNVKPSEEYAFGDVTMHIEHRYRVLQSCLETRFTFRQGDRVEQRGNWHFVFTLAEFQRMFDAAGFDTEECYSSFDKTPYELGSDQLYLVVRRRQ